MLRNSWSLVKIAFVSALLLMFAVACREEEPVPTPSPAEAVATTEAAVEEFVAAYPLAATMWQAEFFGPPEESVPLLPDTRAGVVYFWDRYAGFNGCAWFLGVYEADTAGLLRMMTPARTPNYCDTPPGLYEQAALFDSALLNVTEYEIVDEQLIANTVDDQRMLTFSPGQPVPMPGTIWEVKFWWETEKEAWAPVVPGVASTLEFGAEGEAAGSGGCNDFTVTYEGDLQIEKVLEATDTYAELPTLTFGPITSAMTVCDEPDGIMEQEAGFFASLVPVAYYFKVGGVLFFLDAEGTPLLMLAGAQLIEQTLLSREAVTYPAGFTNGPASGS